MMKKLIVGLSLGVAAFSPASAQKAKLVDVDDGKRVATAVFAQIPNMFQPRISPDGTKLVYLVGAGGMRSVAVLDTAQPDPKPVIIASMGEFKEIGDRDIRGYRFVGNDTVVLTLVSREDAYGRRGDLSRLFAYNLKTKKQTPLAWENAFGSAADILHIDHDKQELIVQRQSDAYGTERIGSPEVISVNVATGKYAVVMRPNPMVDRWFVDGKGVIRGGRGGDSRSGKDRLLYRSNASGTLTTVSSTIDKDFTGEGINPVIFLDEPDMAIVTSNKDGLQKIYKANMRTLELGKPLFERPGFDAGGVLPNEDRNKVLGFAATEDRTRYYWLDSDHKQIQQFLDEGFGKGNAQIVGSDRKERRFLIQAGDTNQAGAYYVYDTESGSFKQVGWSNVMLRDRRLNPVKTISYRASDGVMIPAVVTMPRHRKGKNLPVVMITHGGPFGVRDEEQFEGWSQSMAELGYVVIQPNYRGSGGYGAEFIKKGRNDGFGHRMQDDLNDGIAYLAAQGIVDPKRAAMMGWSYGGYASARAAQRDPDKWRATVAGAGVYDLPAMKAYDVNYLGSFGSNYLAKGAADLKSVSPTHNARGKWAPILIVHGLRDQRVPINQARGLVAALRGSGKTKGVDFDYIEQPKNTHNLDYNDVRVQWLEGAEKWFAKHNPAYIDSDTDKPVPVGLTLKTASN